MPEYPVALVYDKVGDAVNVSINLRGKEYTNKNGEVSYFNQLQGWKIEKTDSAISS